MEKQGRRSLSGIHLFEDLDAAQAQTLGERCTWHTYVEDEQIIESHDESRDVYFIVEGRVRVVNYSLSGREISFDDLTTGDYFGELAAIDGGPRSANVVAMMETTVAIASPSVFMDFLREHPPVAVRVMRRLSYVVRRATERIMDLSTLGANNRVHAELLRQAMTKLSSDNSAEIRPIPHHSDIASRVSTTRETVARVLSDLAKKEIVIKSGKSLKIPDVQRLAAMVEEVRGD